MRECLIGVYERRKGKEDKSLFSSFFIFQKILGKFTISIFNIFTFLGIAKFSTPTTVPTNNSKGPEEFKKPTINGKKFAKMKITCDFFDDG